MAETHSPLPWRTVETCHCDIVDATGSGVVFDMMDTENHADRDFLLLAVNCHHELLDALKGMLAGFEAKAFCRNTEGDGSSDWAVKFMPHFMALVNATRAIEKAEGR